MDDDNDGGSDDSDDVYNVWWKGCLSTICDGIVCVARALEDNSDGGGVNGL